MQTELHVVDDIFAHRFAGREPRYALLISHGIGGHSGIYNRFCEHHAAQGADVWAYDAPGHGRSTMTGARGRFTLARWVDACTGYARHIRATTGLPVIALGSSLGVAATFSALYSDDISGAVLMGAGAVPSAAGGMLADRRFRAAVFDYLDEVLGPAVRLDIARLINFDEDYGYAGAAEQKRLDPYNTWMYDFASWRSFYTFDPQIPADRNEKPILFAIGENDAISSAASLEACARSIAGPVRFEKLADAGHQLMLFDTDRFSALVHSWALEQVARR